MDDSRKLGENNSRYQPIYGLQLKENDYTAWEKKCDGDECKIARCNINTTLDAVASDISNYRRGSCEVFEREVDSIVLNSNRYHSPTGIGAGKMYIGKDLTSYRDSYTGDSVYYENARTKQKLQTVFIGRPIKCDTSK